jgi:hypothetical protein
MRAMALVKSARSATSRPSRSTKRMSSLASLVPAAVNTSSYSKVGGMTSW